MLKRILTSLDLTRLVLLVGFCRIAAFLPLTDPDYFWHLETGRQILEQGMLPAGDIFSFTRDGAPWVLHEWLFQVLLFAVHEWFGDTGVRLLAAVLVTAALLVTDRSVRRLFHAPLAAALTFAAALYILDPFIAPRPQLVSFLLFALFLALLQHDAEGSGQRRLWLLPPLMLVWANSHGGYPIGIVLVAIYVAGQAVRRLTAVQCPRVRAQLHRLGAVAALVVLASGVTPYFWEGWVYPFETLRLEAADRFISEWQSPDFHNRHFQLYLLLLVLLFTVSLYRRRRPAMADLLISVLFPVAGFISARHIPFAVFALLPQLAGALADGAAAELAAAWERTGLAARYRAGVARSGELGEREFLLNWMVLGVAAAAFSTGHPAALAVSAREAVAKVPVASADYIERSGLKGRMFNAYHFGGYLIHRLYPRQRVFIDGRADVYGDELVKEYRAIYNGAPQWRELFSKYGFDYVVCERDAPIRQLLLADGRFELAQDDPAGSVLVRKGPPAGM